MLKSYLQIDSLSKSFDGGQNKVISDVSFEIQEGDVLGLIGESGSGKTTLARLIAGLETPESGTISIKNKVLSSISQFVVPERRKIGLVFQDYALFPHFNVFKNVSFGLKKVGRRDVRVQELLNLVGLEGLDTRYPHELSGGQQQRVALARALAPNPKLLILDEPFSNLDTGLKKQLRGDIFNILRSENMTTIFITHDTKDAIKVADTILVLQNGKSVQQGSVSQLKESPINDYVSSLFDQN